MPLDCYSKHDIYNSTRRVYDNKTMTITAQDLYNYTKCKHRVYLDSNGDPEERGEVSSFVQLLWEMGLQTERDHLDQLGGVDWENLEALSVDRAAERTLSLMHSGVSLIYQGVLQFEDLVGRPDLLIRSDERVSNFGDYLYEPVDIKAGKGWETNKKGEKTRFKTHYAFQVMFYRFILEKLQGSVLSVGRIVNVDLEFEEFDPTALEADFADAFDEVKQLVSGREKSEPVLGSTCHQCGWYAKCRRWTEGTHDPTLLFFVGKNKFQLKQAGLKTVDDIAKMDVDYFLKPANKLPRLGEASLRRMKERAQVKLAGEPLIHPGYEFQDKKEIYLDIEDDPTRDHTYLFGLVEKDAKGDWFYHYFLAEKPEDEEQTARVFWDYIAATEDAVFYVYSHKERSSLKHLMERYDLDPDVFEKYLESEFDLYQDLVVKYSNWPTYSYGIKHIATQVGFKWRDTDPGGANSIAWYNEYLADPEREELLQRILDYNEDDCYAMIAVKDYFEAKLRTETTIPNPSLDKDLSRHSR